MTKLIRARLARYMNSRIFLLAWLICLGLGVFTGLGENDLMIPYQMYVKKVWLIPPLDDIWLLYPIWIVIALIALELGREHADGAIRNKLTAGHSRKTICIAEIISSLIVTVCLFIAFIVPTVLCAMDFYFGLPTAVFINFIVNILLFFMVWSIIATAFTLLFSSRSMMLIAIVPVIIMLYILNSDLRPYYYNTDPPEITVIVEIGYGTGDLTFEERRVKNEYYTEGLTKALINVEHEINPYSRLYNICNYAYLNHPENAWDEEELKEYHTTEHQLMYDCLIMILTGAVLSVGAAFAFEHKDLK